MQPSFAARTGPSLIRTPSYRRQALRRRVAVVVAIASLALASGLLGSLVHPRPAHPSAAPFSYFPSQ